MENSVIVGDIEFSMAGPCRVGREEIKPSSTEDDAFRKWDPQHNTQDKKEERERERQTPGQHKLAVVWRGG
jgi:hypothetical protein